jgi:hypothetical protein
LGHYPTSFWQPGQVIADEVPIPVDPEADAPSLLRLDVGLYQRDTGSRLTVVDASGEEIGSPTLGSLRMATAEEVAPPAFPADYRLGEDIALIGYGLHQSGDELTLTLHWACLAPLELDYTVFAHLTDSAGQLVSQADGPPAEGAYPTSAWVPGEVIAEERVFAFQDLAPGTYQILVGMYLLESGERLPAVDAEGEILLDDTVPLAEVELP